VKPSGAPKQLHQ